MVSLQLVDFRHVRHDGLLVVPQAGQLVLQSAVHLDGYSANFLPTQTRSFHCPASPTKGLNVNTRSFYRSGYCNLKLSISVGLKALHVQKMM